MISMTFKKEEAKTLINLALNEYNIEYEDREKLTELYTYCDADCETITFYYETLKLIKKYIRYF